MTYPDRELRTYPRWRSLIVSLILLFLIFAAMAAEASFRNKVCISAATVDSTGATTFTPEVCE